jgi:hypothetical protein
LHPVFCTAAQQSAGRQVLKDAYQLSNRTPSPPRSAEVSRLMSRRHQCALRPKIQVLFNMQVASDVLSTTHTAPAVD